MASPSVGVVGDEALADAFVDAGHGVTAGSVETVLESDADRLVAVGEAALLALARARPASPVVPVGDAGPVEGPSIDAIREDPALALEHDPVTHRVLDVEVAGEHHRAAADVALVAAHPGIISAFAVTHRGEPVGQFRADGVVAATSLGAGGYARRIGAPRLTPETGVVSVTPIAPFATDPDQWVCPPDGLALSVAREGDPVELVVDGRDVATVAPHDPVTLSVAGTAAVAAPARD